MNIEKKEQTLQYINDKRTESKLPFITEIEISETLKEQFFKDQYVAMKINEAKKLAELELEMIK